MASIKGKTKQIVCKSCGYKGQISLYAKPGAFVCPECKIQATPSTKAQPKKPDKVPKIVVTRLKHENQADFKKFKIITRARWIYGLTQRGFDKSKRDVMYKKYEGGFEVMLVWEHKFVGFLLKRDQPSHATGTQSEIVSSTVSLRTVMPSDALADIVEAYKIANNEDDIQE